MGGIELPQEVRFEAGDIVRCWFPPIRLNTTYQPDEMHYYVGRDYWVCGVSGNREMALYDNNTGQYVGRFSFSGFELKTKNANNNPLQTKGLPEESTPEQSEVQGSSLPPESRQDSVCDQ